jgi:hypothetical protein
MEKKIKLGGSSEPVKPILTAIRKARNVSRAEVIH